METEDQITNYIEYLTVQDITAYFDGYVVGQEELKKRLASVIYLFLQKRNTVLQGNEACAKQFPSVNMLLMGNTGTGKTFLAEKTAELLQIPFIRVDCTTLSQEGGWVGNNISDILYGYDQLVHNCKGGIIFLDEFDKLTMKVTTSGGGCPATAIQTNLMPLLDGAYSGRSEKGHALTHHFNNCLIIAAGAFEAATEGNKEKLGIGFNSVSKRPVEDLKNLIVAAGIIPELAGRITCLAETATLTESDILSLIMNKKDSPLQKYVNMQRSEIQFSIEEKRAIAKKAANSRYGVRELRRIIFEEVHKKLHNEESCVDNSLENC